MQRNFAGFEVSFSSLCFSSPLEVQKKIAKLSDLHRAELALTGRLIDEKNKLFQAVINDILK